jgi:hypothetical protein
MRLYLVSAALLIGLHPQLAAAQSPRKLEFGIVAGTSHHDFHFRYPGEKPWNGDLGFRIDFRVVPTRFGVVGFAAIVNRYSYSEEGFYCVGDCNFTLRDAGGSAESTFLPRYEPWQVTRYGIGVNIDRRLLGAIHGQLGVLAGETSRKLTTTIPHLQNASIRTREWFAGLEGGATYRWRDLAIGAGAEYGFVPRTEYAIKPYYGRLSARVAYAVPLRR